MDRPIRVGDLVMVVKPTLCCGEVGISTGAIFKVSDIEYDHSSACNFCGAPPKTALAYGFRSSRLSVGRLKRIDPPAQPETVRTEDEVTA